MLDFPECEKRTDEIRREYNPQNLSPFPYENITTKKQDLQISLVDFESDEHLSDISGAIFYTENESIFKIFINSNKPKTRQNFTIAHELGHYFLHAHILREEGGIVDGDDFIENRRVLYRIDTPQERDKIETEANFFAASLLMPKDLVADAWKRIGDIKACADIFGVSPLAMTIRLTRLGYLNDD